MRKLITLVLILLSFNTLATQSSGSMGGISTGLPSINPTPSADIEVLLGRGENSSPAKLNLLSNPLMMRLQDPNALHDEVMSTLDGLSLCGQETEQCNVAQPSLPKDYLDFLMSYSDFKPAGAAPLTIPGVRSNVQSSCECLRDKLKGKTSAEDFGKKVEAEKKVINDKIIDALGRKFVNDFSSNIEDVSFFLTKTKDMFSNEELAKSLQCNDQSAYNSKIDEVCTGKGIKDTQFIKNRKDKLINILTGQKISFEDRLGTMSREIMSAQITSDFKDTDGNIYARESYDSMRLSLATYDPQAVFMDQLSGKLFRDSFFLEKIRSAMLGDKTPVEAIIKVINENRDKPEFANLGLSSVDVDSYLKDSTTTVNSFKFMMKVHPGFLQTMKDKRAFNSLVTAFKNAPNAGLLTVLAKDKTVLEPVLVENCKKMISDFAHAVCTTDEDLIANMEPVDLSRLIHAGEQTAPGVAKKPVVSDLLVCLSKMSSVPESQKFKELANLIDTRLRSTASDYYERSVTTADGGPSTDAFTSAGNFSASPAGNHLATILTDEGHKLSKSVSAGGVVSTQVYAENVASGKNMNIGSGAMSREDARKYLAQARSYDEKKASQKEALNNSTTNLAQTSSTNEPKETANSITDLSQSKPSNVSNTSAPQNVSYSSSSRNSANEAREALRQYIADKNSGTFAQNAVAGLDDPSAVELNRLRSENLGLLEKTLKFENEKFEDMKKKIADLEKTTPAVVQTSPEKLPEVDRNQSSSNLRQSFTPSPAVQKTSNQNASRSIASVSGKFSTQNPVSVTTSDSTVNGRGKNPVSEMTPSSSSLRIETKPGKASEIVPQELKVEVQKILDNPSLDLSSLEEIKSKGFMYRYSAVENNEVVQKEILVKFESLDKSTRDAIELKLTRKSAENQVSKLAVLRLLIKQNQRL